MAFISLQNISIAFGGSNILENINLQIEKNQRICLLGRNGTGKSTLMKIIAGQLAPDQGTVQTDKTIRVSYFAQEIPQNLQGSVFEIIAQGLGVRGELLAQYHQEAQRISEHPETDHVAINQLHDEMDKHDAWSALEEISSITTRMSLNPEADYNSLSGGQKRRVLLASALVSNPDLLLLDEPTNHIDVSTIVWLEEYLLRLGTTMLFVTHDRMFLRKLATRIIELDRGSLVDWSCDYNTFLERKQAVLEIEEKEWEKFDKKLAQEEIWIRKGIKARRTRNEGRVRELMKMREEQSKRRLREEAVSMNMADVQKSGKLVFEAKDVSFSYDDNPLISHFETIIARGDKIGIIGPNGCGKTTLINIIVGKLAPLTGTIRHGTNLAITYFDQMREQINESQTVWENVLPHGDYLTLNGQKKHIVAYLQDFLFTPEQAKSPASNLSGGERNRLLLARLFSQPTNMLVLDEPTNDLDAETLELLEELLVEFEGTLLLITHDRAFLNNVVTSTFVFETNGRVREFIGGYDEWFMQLQPETTEQKAKHQVSKREIYKETKKAKQTRKLSFKEKRELELLPGIIETLEHEQQDLHQKMGDPELYRDKDTVVAAQNRLNEIDVELANAYERWEFLESIES
ncbi:ATP-binding cassette domain-containing protein [candidate division KSB1 bacterium]|nr:ATP-binding cassette domain-containing protein [candidate division KSB1 bacterium]